jgi:Tol biopolymer transport system component
MTSRAERNPVLLSIIILAASSLCSCGGGGGGSGPPAPPAQAHVLEALPFDRLGAGKIVFHRGDFSAQGWRDGIYMIDPASRTTRFEFDGGNGWYPAGPQVSPDGLRIAYTRLTDNKTLFDVYVANLDGSAATRVSAFPGQEGPPSWSPDGQELVFYAWETNIGENFYRQPPTPGTSQLVPLTKFPGAGGCPSINDFYADRVSIAPSGQFVWICYGNIELTAVDGSATSPIYSLPSSAPAFTELHSASWSPNGQSIAFLELFRDPDIGGSGAGERKQMLVKLIDAQGRNETVLATVPSSGVADMGGDHNIYSLCWAADGSRIFFNVADGNIQSHIWVVNADGTGLAQVTNAPDVWDHSVSCSR